MNLLILKSKENSSHAALNGRTVTTLIIVVFWPQHHPSISARSLNDGKDFRGQHVGRNEPTSSSVGRCRLPQEDLRIDRRGPPVPRVQKVRGVAGGILARRIVIELHPDIIEKACVEGSAEELIWEWTLWGCTEICLSSRLAQTSQGSSEFIPVLSRTEFDIKVYTVQHCIT